MKKAVSTLLISSCGILKLAYGASPDCFVNAHAIAPGDGKTWATAYSDLQSALGDSTCVETWVARGVYKPTSSSDRSVSFSLQPGMRVYGGFDGTESTFSRRNPEANATVLSGDIDSNDANSGGSEIDEVSDIRGSNSYHVVRLKGTSSHSITAATTLDGFTITGGDADSNSGGGLYCSADGLGGECSPTLSNLVFSGNYAGALGGAVINEGLNFGKSDAYFYHVVFVSNASANFGGAVANDGEYDGESSPSFDSCLFLNNSTATNGAGGAMLNQGGERGQSNPRIVQTLFRNNSSYFGGAVANVASDFGSMNPTFSNTSFVNNLGNNYGGAIYTLAGYRGSFANLSIDYSTFSGNRNDSGLGAALSSDPDGALDSVHIDVSNSIIWDAAPYTAPEFDNPPAVTLRIKASIVWNACGDTFDCGCADATSCADVVGSDPLLGSLADHGGFTWTMLPQEDSPAIDSAEAGASACPAIDQRDLARPGGSRCDRGAVERQTIEDVIFRDRFQVF